MESLLAATFAKLSFFATGLGLLTTGAVAVSIILVWRWRLALLSLLVVQIGVAVLVVRVHGAPYTWAAIELLVMLICLAMLALSAHQVQAQLARHQPGSLLLRGATVLLMLASWRVFDLKVDLPVIAPQVIQLFVWLGLCTLVLLSLSDTPFFTGVALLLWSIPIQAIVQILLPAPALFVLIGMVQIMLTLACSYLILTVRLPATVTQQVNTDLTFAPEPLISSGLSNGSTNGIGVHGLLTGPNPAQRALSSEQTGEYPLAVERRSR